MYICIATLLCALLNMHTAQSMSYLKRLATKKPTASQVTKTLPVYTSKSTYATASPQQKRTWREWAASFSPRLSGKPWLSWFSTPSFKQWYQPKVIKYFTLPPNKITPETLWSLYDYVLKEPFKYDETIVQTQLVALRDIINVERDNKTILCALLQDFLYITAYQRDDRGREKAYYAFISRYTNHSDALLKYAYKIIELGGNLGLASEKDLSRLLLQIEQLKLFFDKNTLSIDNTKKTIKEMMAPFSAILQTIAHKANIEFEKLEKKISANAIQWLYWDAIDDYIKSNSFATMKLLISFYPHLLNLKNNNGMTLLDTIFKAIFMTKEVGDFLEEKPYDTFMNSPTGKLFDRITDQTRNDSLFGDKRTDIMRTREIIISIIDMGAQLSNKNIEQAIIQYYAYGVSIFNIFKFDTYFKNKSGRLEQVREYVNELHTILRNLGTKYNISWQHIEVKGKEYADKLWHTYQQKQSQKQESSQQGHKKEQHQEKPSNTALTKAYKTLDLHVGTPFAQVKIQHKKLAKQYHPDIVIGKYTALIDAELNKKPVEKKKVQTLEAEKESTLKLFEQKMKDINNAFDIIEQAQ